jgi:MFS family permease
VVALLISVFIIDRVGLKASIALFSLLCFAGSVCMAVKGDIRIIVVGRALLGMGAEPLIAAITTAIAKWFRGKELSFAFAVNLTIARLASVAADRSPSWASWAFYPHGPSQGASWQGPMLIAVVAGVLCLAGAALYWAIENAGERRFQLGEAGSVDRLDFTSVFRFSAQFWYVLLLCLCFYSIIFPFRTFAIEFFNNTLLIGQGGLEASEAVRVAAHQDAGELNSLLPLWAMIATPIFGFLADRFKRRALLMSMGAGILMPVFMIMVYTRLPLSIPVAMMGMAFSLIPAVMWPYVAYLVEQRRLGSAYALMALIQQMGFAAMNYVIGWTNDYAGASLANTNGYVPGMWIFTALAVISFLLAGRLFLSEQAARRAGLTPPIS